MINYPLTIAAQYANSPTIVQLIDNVNQWIDPSWNFTQFYEKIWNIATADTYGLDLLGRIIGVSRRFITISQEGFFGFSGHDPDYQPFNQAPFFNGTGDNSQDLDNDAYRIVLMAKAFVNISDTSIPNLNKALILLFTGRGRCYVQEIGTMAISYTFEFSVSQLDREIIKQVMPHPAGVSVVITEV